MDESGPRTIGEVLGLLKREFSDLTVSKLRFLEGQGLIRPGRSPSGYREYWDDDLERLRYILRQQRDHFLPLKVIKDKLEGWERGAVTPTALPEGPPPDTYFAFTDVSLNIDELCQTAGLDRHQAEELIVVGVLVPLSLDDGTTVFREDDVAVARAAHELLNQGLEPRHLKGYRLAVDREFELLRRLTAAQLRHRRPEARHEAASILAACGHAARELSDAMLRIRLRDLLNT
ncbi:MAG: MerR family transcriptional regulator [Acidimicrobiia bacterium]